MKLLILTNYFTPDLSAGSFRMQGLVEALSEIRSEGLEVDLITTRPNRYASLKAEAEAFEDLGWLRIHRIDMPAHKSGMADQARAYLSYVRGVRSLTRGQRWDLVFATSSRLMTAGLGANIARRMKAPLYLDIRDLFTDNMRELLAGSPLKLLMPAFKGIERYAFRSATRINVVSEGFIGNIARLVPGMKPAIFTNGIDDLFLANDFEMKAKPDALPLIVYAGNQGEGQGLHRIIPQAAKLLDGKARIRVIGDGGRRKALEDVLRAEGRTNVELLPPVPRSELLQHYRQADILFLHLNDLDAFRKVLPSKIFEYGATGKPVLAGVAGYAAKFLQEELPCAEVFEPLDAEAMAEAALRLLAGPGTYDRSGFRNSFSRKAIMQNMAQDIMSLMPSRDSSAR